MSDDARKPSRVVLVTGAGGGIGRATVDLFASSGWRVIGVDRSEFGAEFPQNGLFIRSDIANPQDLATIFEQAHAFTGSLDALVNNAAVQVAKPLLDTSVEPDLFVGKPGGGALTHWVMEDAGGMGQQAAVATPAPGAVTHLVLRIDFEDGPDRLAL